MSTPISDRGIVFGTERTRTLLDRLGSCDDELKIIHIAGTNGKGSIAEYFTEIIISSGAHVGTFTSPEVFDYFDQFRVDGKKIPRDRMTAYLAEVKSLNDIGATTFEEETVAAIYAFYKEGCSWCVLECGMGGKLDSTNAIHKKEIAVISSISLEHTDFLGSTLKEICAHKAGIIVSKGVVSPLQCAEVRAYFEKLNNPELIFADKPKAIDEHTFIYNGESYEINSSGEEQLSNAATAVAGALALGFKSQDIKRGLKRANLIGRRQEIRRDRLFILDGGHNAESLKYLADYILKEQMPTELVYGSLRDKDIVANFKELSRAVDKITLVECPSTRAIPLEKMQLTARDFFSTVQIYEDMGRAIAETRAERVIICGSFTLLKEAVKWIEKRQ